ncbi:MAG: hypothetical protein Q8R44_09675 [Novosphingobium sp.]|nr:hypothetical protein [Novosphingobium sp.]
MIPNVDDRLASVIRALTEVVLPHLPPEASLAQEQVQLSVGHLQILRAQLDALPGYEQEELADARALGQALASCSGGPETQAAQTALTAAVAAQGEQHRALLKAINEAIEALVRAVGADGDAASRGQLSATILKHEHARSQKDRQWFAPFGFDTL